MTENLCGPAQQLEEGYYFRLFRPQLLRLKGTFLECELYIIQV